MTTKLPEHELNRRRFLAVFSAAGLSAALPPEVTKDMLKNAEEIAGLQFTEEERELMLEGVNEHLADYEKLRTVSIPNGVPPALYFNPRLPGMSMDGERRPIRLSEVRVDSVPANLEEVAFWPVTHLSKLIESRRVSSTDLTKKCISADSRSTDRSSSA